MADSDKPSSTTQVVAYGFADLARTGAPGWWRYLLSAIAIFGGGVGALYGLAELVPVEALWLVVYGVRDWRSADLTTALGALAAVLVSVALFLPLTLLAVRFIHRRPWIGLLTGRGQFSWRLLAKSLGVTLGVSGAVFLIGILFGWFQPIEIQTTLVASLAALVIVLLLVPFQAGAEEVVFRGYLLQAVAHATHRFWVRLLVPAIPFCVMHFWNPEVIAAGLPAYINYAVVSLYFGWLALRSNGLEIAIGLHFGMNVFAIGVVSTRDTIDFAPGFFYLPAPNYWAILVGDIVVCALHWLIVRRWLRDEREAADRTPIAKPPGRA